MTPLPVGWMHVKLEDVAEVNPRKFVDLSLDDFVTFVPMAAVDEINGVIKERVSRRLTEVNKGFTQFAEGDVLFAKITPSMENGKAVVARGLENGIGFGSTEFHVLRSYGAILPEYLWLFVRQAQFRKDAQAVMSGAVGQQRVPSSFLKNRVLPLPPLAEQARIVAKAQDFLSRTNQARTNLGEVPELLKRYRKRQLNMAFNGQLVDKPTIGTVRLNEQCWDLPSDWRWVKLGDVAVIASNPVNPQDLPDLPHIAPDNIEAGTGKLLAFRTLAEDGVTSKKQRFNPGQILYSKIRPYLKKAVIVDFDGACSADIYALNAGPKIEAKFLLYWLISDDFALFSAMHERRSVLPKINRKALSGTPFPLPPISQQRSIIHRLDKAFQWISHVAFDHGSASAVLPNLDDSILTRAFRGGLANSAKDDESAADLMRRVKTAIDQAGKRSITRKKPSLKVTKIVAKKLTDVLRDAQGWVTAQEAFRLCGIQEGSETDSIEILYRELRELDRLGQLETDSVRDANGRKIEDRLKLRKT